MPPVGVSPVSFTKVRSTNMEERWFEQYRGNTDAIKRQLGPEMDATVDAIQAAVRSFDRFDAMTRKFRSDTI